MALLPRPPALLGELRDKYQHMLAFAALAAAGAFAFPHQSLWRLGERLSFLGALIEIAQSVPGLNRECDALDWLADTAAVAIVLVAIRLLRLRE